MSYAFVCPRCLAPSASDVDALHGYCGRCCAFTGTRDVLEAMPAAEYYRWTRACRSYGVPAQNVRHLGQVPPEVTLTPRTLLEEPCWIYEGTEDGGQVAVFRFDPVAAPWAGCWRPEGLGRTDVRWEHGGTLRVRVRTEVVARAVMDLISLPGPVSRAWSWDELRQLHEQSQRAVSPREAGTAQYLALREAGYSSAEATARAMACDTDPAAASFAYQAGQLSAGFPPGLAYSAEGVAELAADAEAWLGVPAMSVELLGATGERIAAALGLLPAVPAPDNSEGVWDEHWGDAMDWTAGMPEL